MRQVNMSGRHFDFDDQDEVGILRSLCVFIPTLASEKGNMEATYRVIKSLTPSGNTALNKLADIVLHKY